jgi:hypothetical protein
MPTPRIFIEGPLENDRDWLAPYSDLAAWQPHLVLRADNGSIADQYGDNLGAADIAQFLADKPPSLRSIKLGWFGSSWFFHKDTRTGLQHEYDVRDFTDDDKLFHACRTWKVDTGHVAGKMRAALTILHDANATDGLLPYAETEREILLQSSTLTARIMNDAQCVRNIFTHGGRIPADASEDEITIALNYGSWSDRAKAIRAPFIIAGRQLMAKTIGELLRSHQQAYASMAGFVMSNTARHQSRDQNGHRMPAIETTTPKHTDMVYLHNPDAHVFPNGKTGLDDTLGVLRAARSRAMCINLHAGQLTPAEMAWRIGLATRAPSMIFADNPARTKDRIIQTLELVKELA